jgi:hypothetical protein
MKRECAPGARGVSSRPNPAKCIHSQDFAGVPWVFSLKPFLESCYVALATRGLAIVHFIATFTATHRTLHVL